MLRELGIALIECEQPAQLVRARLLAIARQYTHQTVRVVPFAMLGTSVAAIFSIALGTLVGWSVLETIKARLSR
jgi:hypothetical protein